MPGAPERLLVFAVGLVVACLLIAEAGLLAALPALLAFAVLGTGRYPG